MTTPTPPRDLREHAPAGRIITPDPAAVTRFMATMAEQRAAQPHAAKVRLVLSDEQYADVTTRRANGESWAGLARALNMTQTTLMAAYARQTAAKRQETPQ